MASILIILGLTLITVLMIAAIAYILILMSIIPEQQIGDLKISKQHPIKVEQRKQNDKKILESTPAYNGKTRDSFKSPNCDVVNVSEQSAKEFERRFTKPYVYHMGGLAIE